VRLIKWVSLGLGALVALVVLGVLVIVWLVDPNSFKSNIEAAVRDNTGREFTLVGDIDLGFFPWLALRTGEGSFGNAPGFAPEPMVTWKSAQLGVKLIPLARRQADR
jgi:AsmA protein